MTEGVLQIDINEGFCSDFKIESQLPIIRFDVRSGSSETCRCDFGRKTLELWIETRWETIKSQGNVVVSCECGGCGRHRPFLKRKKIDLQP